MLRHVQQVVMIAPVNPEKDVAQHITAQHRQQRSQPRQRHVVRWSQLQHHDRDKDRDYAITECFNSCGCHQMNPWRLLRKLILCATATSVCNWHNLFAFEDERTLTTFLAPR